MCLHNVYTIRGAFPRDAMQWSDSIARSLMFEGTEFLISGHNWPVFGKAEVRQFLSEQRDGVKYMHDQTLRLMSHGYVPTEIADAIEFPPALARLWHLRGYYGSIKHNVRGIYAYYLGWYDGNPANLDSLPPREHARRTLDYMGGIDAVLKRARTDYEDGHYRWVAHILDQVIWVEPGNLTARELAAATHTQMGYASENATWRNAYLSAANELREGIPKGEKNHRVLRDVFKGMSPLLLMNSLSIRLNGPKAVGHAFTINWKIVGTEEVCHSELTNAVLVSRKGTDRDAGLTITLPQLMLSEFVLDQIGTDAISGPEVSMEGDENLLAELASLLDTFPAWFPIATHDLKQGETGS